MMKKEQKRSYIALSLTLLENLQRVYKLLLWKALTLERGLKLAFSFLDDSSSSLQSPKPWQSEAEKSRHEVYTSLRLLGDGFNHSDHKRHLYINSHRFEELPKYLSPVYRE